MMKFADKNNRKPKIETKKKRKTETAIATARAQVMLYDDGIKKWIPTGSNGTQGIAKVQIYQHLTNHSFRVVARKVQDHEVVLNCALSSGLKYNEATCTFHQWRDQRQVYGLNFTTADEAGRFSTVMAQALKMLNCENNGVILDQFPLLGDHAPSTGDLHDFDQQQQQQQQQRRQKPSILSPHHAQSAPNFHQLHHSNGSSCYDDDCEASPLSSHTNTCRKNNQPAAPSVNSQHLRRASQESNGSSGSTPSTGSHLYGASPSRVQTGHNSASRLAPLSSTAPPAPPPPPSLIGPFSEENSCGLVDQLKTARLRKTHDENGLVNANGNGLTSTNGPMTSGNARTPSSGSLDPGRGGLMSELEATINRRKNLAEGKSDVDFSLDNKTTDPAVCPLPLVRLRKSRNRMESRPSR